MEAVLSVAGRASEAGAKVLAAVVGWSMAAAAAMAMGAVEAVWVAALDAAKEVEGWAEATRAAEVMGRPVVPLAAAMVAVPAAASGGGSEGSTEVSKVGVMAAPLVVTGEVVVMVVEAMAVA